MVRDCKVCGNSYNTCYSCEKERSWRLHTDTHEHYYIWTVLMDYQINHDAKKTYNVLRKRGVDFQNTTGYLPKVRSLLAEIYSLAQSVHRVNKVTVETEEVKHEDAGKDETKSQQEE